MRIELTTSSLPRKCSTPELQRLVQGSPTDKNRFDESTQNIQKTRADPPPGQIINPLFAERKTRFEPATYSLEGCRSTN